MKISISTIFSCLSLILISNLNSFSQIIQTSGPIGGRFNNVLIVKKPWKYLSAGPNHVLAIDAQGFLWGWGRNDYGQIDGKFSSNVYEPVLIDSTKSWVSVAAGETHSLGVDDEGNLYSWGFGPKGQLGQKEKIHITSFKRIDTLSVDGSRKFSADLVKFVKVVAGNEHSVALQDNWSQNGYIYVFGENDGTGALGLPYYTQYFIPDKLDISGVVDVSCGWGNTFVIREDGSLWGWV